MLYYVRLQWAYNVCSVAPTGHPSSLWERVTVAINLKETSRRFVDFPTSI